MPVRRFLSVIFAICLVLIPLVSNVPQSQSDELDDVNKEISKLTEALNQSIAATKPLESQLTAMQQQITSIKTRVNGIEYDLVQKEKSIDEGYKKLAQKEDILNETIRSFYIKSYYNSPLTLFLSATTASDITNLMMYQRAKTNQDKSIITNLALTLKDLEDRRTQLKSEQKRLISLKATLDEQSKKLDGTIKGAKDYQREVTGKLAELTARQQSILSAKSGGFTVSGSNELADEYNSSIKGFNEAAPAGSFAVFSFGAYTHRKGMSQYGALGRAKSGQDYKAILKAYYQKEPVQKDTGGDIQVTGYGSMNFEERYLLGIAEMPSSWPLEALKAQAVAARTYAYRYKAEGKEICTTEACQVYNSGKADNPPALWKQAVEETRGMVLEDVVTYFSSTTGGWTSPLGWDTTDGSGGSGFISRAYESIGGSPWLYKAWFREGYTTSGSTCGRSGPWLSGEEMADIVNAYLVLTQGSSSEAERISPITTSCWGGNPYSYGELRDVAGKYGGISNATSVSVTQGDGSTNSVTINGISMNANEFKKAFNLRAPGYVRIPQTGFAFFNIEHK